MTDRRLSPPVLNFDPARRTNAQAIADLARLGILTREQRILDLTGRAGKAVAR